jgi:hypothetical protein
MVERAYDYRFSTVDLPIARIRQRLADIAGRFNLEIDRWEEDGLGWAQGMFVRLASGRVMLLRELEHAVKHLGAKGPGIYLDASYIAEAGVGVLIADVLETLDLPKEELDWIAGDEVRETAVDLVAWADRLRAERSAQPDRTARER